MRVSGYLPLIIGITAVLFTVERLFPPLRRRRATLFARLVVNFSISGLAYLAAIIVVRPSALHTLNWASRNSFGLLSRTPAPDWLRFILGFLLLDLSFYYWHIMNHKIAVLWRF